MKRHHFFPIFFRHHFLPDLDDLDIALPDIPEDVMRFTRGAKAAAKIPKSGGAIAAHLLPSFPETWG
jgi:hypothetical protein